MSQPLPNRRAWPPGLSWPGKNQAGNIHRGRTLGQQQRDGRPGAPSLLPRLRDALYRGSILLARPELGEELARVDHRLQRGLLLIAHGCAPTVRPRVSSVARNAPQHDEGRAIDIGFRSTGTQLRVERRKNPHFNTNTQMILGTLLLWRKALAAGGSARTLPTAIIEADHIHLMVGPTPDGPDLGPTVWVYRGDTSYDTDEREARLLAALGQSHFRRPLRPASDFL